MNNSINYNSSIKAGLKALDFRLSINNDSVVLLNKLLNEVNSKLINYCHSKIKEAEGTGDLLTVAYNAVKEIFPGELKHNAKAEGNKCIILFYNGLLDHSLKSKTSAPDVFSSGIRKLGSITFPDARFEKKALLALNYLLDDLCTKASEKAAETGLSKNKIEVRDFKEAFTAILPKEIQTYANYEGNKKVFEHESNLFTFIPGIAVKKFKPSPRVVPKKQKERPKATSKDVTNKKAERKSKPQKMPKIHINYSNGIRHIAKLENNNLRLSKSAVAVLNHIMNELNYKLIDHYFTSIENFPPNSKVNLEIAEDAINEIFSGELLSHAIVEASKDIFMLQNGMMKYKPQGKKSKEKTKTTTKREFLSGIKSFTGMIFPGAILHAKTRTFISHLLEKLFTKICWEAVYHMENRKKLQYSDIQSILENVLSREMFLHANAGASLALHKYDQGMFSFSPSRIKRGKI